MALFQEPLVMVYDLINKENELPIEVTPQNAPIVKTVAQGSIVTATLKGVRYTGWKNYLDVKYHRIDLGTLFKNVVPSVVTDYGTHSTDIINEVSAATGLSLTDKDIVRVPINWADPENDGVFTCEIKAVDTNLLFTGSFIVKISGMSPTLETVFPNRELAVLRETSPKPQTGPGARQIINAAMLTYGIDYSAIMDFLIDNIPEKTTEVHNDAGWRIQDRLGIELAKKLREVDGNPWMVVNYAPLFNLSSVRVVYHTDVATCEAFEKQDADFGGAPNKDFDRVLLLELDPLRWHGYIPGGRWGIYIHYNNVEVK